MWRLSLSILTLVLLSGALARAQGYGQYGRMSSQEAHLIADYWVRSYFRRAADPRETQYWAQQIVQTSPDRALAELLSSDEYYRYAGGSPQGYVRQLIADVGHREASAYELDGRLRHTSGWDARSIAQSFLREFPRNWWPGPAATPPKELRYYYRGAYGGYGYR